MFQPAINNQSRQSKFALDEEASAIAALIRRFLRAQPHFAVNSDGKY
jgi:hypothetical protein